ncbi:DNA primase large subunit [Naematelia encephala]|uniref:DNA primase large subunit n=1 Tax=Naematelia encephala TaxID=71784 RepID=A0A1Y2APY5_9TREE|nr:DNA primase large subunit [Naematelia encephala]
MFKPTTRHNIASSSHLPEVKLSKRHSTSGQPSSRWPYRLNFYERPPTLDITLEEFETFAIARLQVLSHIESLSHRSLPYAQLSTAIATYLKQHLPLSSNTARNVDLDAERRKDEIGHWVLRLAFCRSPDLRARFLRSEISLFRHRFETDDVAERAQFLRSLEFDWQLVDETEKSQYAHELRTCMPWGTKDEQFKAESWFKVPWYTVPDLVGARRVFIKAGMAYVPQSLQISLVLQAFGSRLEKALELTAKNLPRLDEDERLFPVIDHLAASFLSGLGASDYRPDGETSGAVVTADMVDDVARKHFPPCMRNLYERLKRDRHLKHFGRLQLGLFLKGIGLPLDEAIIFWRKMYGATMSDDKFNKEYKYNIRHSYGQEGKRANYPPKSCQQILTTNQPGTQDSHGCPFRHFSPENLQNFLISTYPQIDRSSPEMRDIMDSVKTAHYHVACTRVFEVTHGLKKGEGLSKDGESVVHPNKYADRSRELEREKLEAVKAKDEDVSMD